MSRINGLRNKGLIAVFLILALISVFFNRIAGYLIDYQWFKELGYTEVFFKKLFTQIQFFAPALLIFFVIFFTYLKSINAHSMKSGHVILSNDEKKGRNKVFAAVSALLAFIFALVFVSEIWYDFLIFINKVSFGLSDPVFGRDIGFYVFSIPFLSKLYGFIIGIIVVLALIAVIFNAVVLLGSKIPKADEDFNVRPIYNSKDIYKNMLTSASKQLSVLGVLFFFTLAFGFWLRTFEILYSGRGVAYGASYTDIHVTLPSYYIFTALCVLTGIMIIMSWWRKKFRLAVFAPLILVAAIVLSGVVSAIVQNIIVVPNEAAKEEKYLQYNIDYTNYAYGLDKVQVKKFDVAQNLNREKIEANRITINNIPINDYRPAKDIYNQIQGLKTYYQFNDIDIDRYLINGVYRQVFISARELQSDNIPKQSGAGGASWINKYLKYTHGYGVAMSPVTEVTPSGQPKLIVRDMPIISDTNIKVDVPQIYFGELTKDFVIVNTREKEFDYPASNASVETTYTGSGGIKLGFLNRLMFAVREGKLNFLLSQDISRYSKILINREIKSRVQKIAPFLIYDEDPYIVTSGGKLYWIIDAYTISNRYPYSEPINERTSTNYIRNSVKVVIDAYNGTTDFYIADTNDPIIKTYANIFKTLFKPLNSMPEDLRAHIRYPQTLFDIQADIYRKYHMKNARDFYNKADVWDIATQIYGSGNNDTQIVESAYLIMRLPDSEKEEFLLMAPYTPQNKTNMISWLGVKNDGENYGQIILYNFPSGKTVEGPMQIENIVSQDTVITSQLSLLTSGGSAQVVRGNMMAIPIEDSLLYVEPIYVRASNESALPELKKVVMFYKNRVVMEDSLELALDRIFPKDKEKGSQMPSQPQQPADTAESSMEELIKRANTVFKEAQEAQRSGNWGEYGNKLSELQRILNQLAEMTNKPAGVPAEQAPMGQ